jgi:rhodanese-related sulfurtransferase
MAPVREAARLLVIAVVVAAVAWAVRPERLPLVADAAVYELDLPVDLVSAVEARRLFDDGTHYFVDTRPGEPAAGIPGSFVVREISFAADLEAILDFLYPSDPLILYGADHPLPVAGVAARLLDQGYEDVRILQGGLAAWTRAGGPLDGEEAAP